jgi:hypothetical protein
MLEAAPCRITLYAHYCASGSFGRGRCRNRRLVNAGDEPMAQTNTQKSRGQHVVVACSFVVMWQCTETVQREPDRVWGHEASHCVCWVGSRAPECQAHFAHESRRQWARTRASCQRKRPSLRLSLSKYHVSEDGIERRTFTQTLYGTQAFIRSSTRR